MVEVKELSTKRASELLGISASSMRLYAKTMESLGYEFKHVENARRYTRYDIQIIAEAMERYRSVGGTMKEALHYTIVKYEQGQEVADAMPTPSQEKDQPSDINEIQNNIVDQINTYIHSELKTYHNKYIKVFKNIENLDLQHLGQHDSDEVEKLKARISELEQSNSKLKNELEQLRTMSMWEFRKWKKN